MRYCFLDEDRPCTPSCMAFEKHSVEEESGCTLIHNVQLLGHLSTLFKRDVADRKREAAQPQQTLGRWDADPKKKF